MQQNKLGVCFACLVAVCMCEFLSVRLVKVVCHCHVLLGRMWFYQTCNEFGYYQTSDSKNQPFGSLFPLSFYVDQCTDVFGPQFNQAHIERGIAWTNENYGGRNISVTRVLFPNGSIDPWHALGITDHVIGPGRSIFIIGTAHCANMYPPLSTDIANLQQARLDIAEQLKLWNFLDWCSAVENGSTSIA